MTPREWAEKVTAEHNTSSRPLADQIAHAIAQAVAEEREACALVAMDGFCDRGECYSELCQASRSTAGRIRKRGAK